jgi:hypothetical protein
MFKKRRVAGVRGGWFTLLACWLQEKPAKQKARMIGGQQSSGFSI